MTMPPNQSNGFFYSVRDIWEEVQKLRVQHAHDTDMLTAAINQLGNQLTTVALQMTTTEKWRETTDKEVEAINRWRYRLPVAVIISFASLIITALGAIFGGTGIHG